jgi:asparagine synthetase B (glutamine-hydrolysing)
MCGISCVVTLRGNGAKANSYGARFQAEAYGRERHVLSQQMEKSLETIKHRGPDGRGYWFSDFNRVGALCCACFSADVLMYSRTWTCPSVYRRLES